VRFPEISKGKKEPDGMELAVTGIIPYGNPKGWPYRQPVTRNFKWLSNYYKLHLLRSVMIWS
jgi:hypothetical protein